MAINNYDIFKNNGTLDEIIKLYESGISTIALGKKYNLSDRTISAYLKKAGVEIRPCGIISRINQDIFEIIDSEIKAYTLGLLMSDGNVSKKGNTISITLTKDDSYILEIINNKLLDNKGNLCLSHKEDKKPRIVLQFNGKKIKKDLAKYNVIPDKTNILTSITNDDIPKELFHHYIRGLFDGDGVCSYYTSHKRQCVRIGFCGKQYDFVNNYKMFLVNTLKLNSTSLFNTGGCWQVSWGAAKDIQAFYDYIYKDATIFLGRKKKKMYDFLSNK